MQRKLGSVVAGMLMLAGALAPAAAASDRLALNASHVSLAVSANGRRRSSRISRAVGCGTHLSRARSTRCRRARACRRSGSRSIGPAAGRRIATRSGGDELATTARATRGPALASLVAACTAPDGSSWALQAWQPKLPHRGYPPYAAGQTDWSSTSRTGPGRSPTSRCTRTGRSTVRHTTCFGRLLYGGVPVHGFHTVSGSGGPQDRYGRSLYIDTFDSAYGRGWRRETSIVFRNPTGVFCYSFWPTHDVSLPGHPDRPAGDGSKYRIEVQGPGVTPNLSVVVQDPGKWDPNDPDRVAYEREMKARQLQLSAGDRFCPTQT